MKKIEGKLILENGKVFKGFCFGHIETTVVGEVVFNTAMTGYQEILTDPSYKGQFVLMTYPLVGNYGTNFFDMESKKAHLNGFIVREACEMPSNFRRELSLDGFLKENKKIGLYGVDTREITKVIRDHGSMKAIITTRKHMKDKEIQQCFNDFTMENAVKEVTIKNIETRENTGTHIAVIDFGTKENILRELYNRKCKLTIFPAFSTVDEILAVNPDGIFLSNGPADPRDLTEVVNNVKALMEKKPVVGICLGHQLISLACGCNIEKLKFGHHGANHPVKDLNTNKLLITSQNHNYVTTNLTEDVKEWFVNINDTTIEGIIHKSKPVMSVQFHPEACPGPVDSNYIFDEFLNTIRGE